MRIAIFGATGTVGSALVRQALDRGYDVRILARSPNRVEIPDLDVVTGDARDPEAVAKTLVGCDVVMSALGGFGDAVSIDVGTENILAAMRAAGLRRLVVVQGFHIPMPGDPRNLGARFVDLMLRLRSPSLVKRSHRLGALLLGCEDLDWTLVRICPVRPGPASGAIREGTQRLGPTSYVTTGDVAEAMLGALSDSDSIRTAPMIRTDRGR